MFQVYADGKPMYHPMFESMVIVTPKLTLEMGKAGSFQFGLPPCHQFYDLLQKLKTRITVELDGVEIFRGRVLSENKNFHNIRSVYCEGDLAYLCDSVQKSEKYTGGTHTLFRKIIEAHNARVEEEKRFVVGQIGIEDREIILSGKSDDTTDIDTDRFDYRQIAINSIVDDWKTTYDYIDTCLIQPCGGYLRTRREGDVTYIDLLTDFGNAAQQAIQYGVNLLDLTESITAEELFTVLIPLGDDNLTIQSVNGGSDELTDAALVATYGRIVRTHVFSNVSNPATLLEDGMRYFSMHANVPVTVTVRAVDLHLTDADIQEIRLGDSVALDSPPHGIDGSLTCTKIEYDFENPGNCSFTFGTPRQSLTERYRKDKRESEEKASSGGGGGAGGAAEAAAEEAEKQLQELYDAYINVNPEAGHIDLKTLYEKYQDGKTVLRQTCGIDLDSPAGNINIVTLRDKSQELDGKFLKQAAQINMINDDLHARIELVTARQDTTDKEAGEHYAEFVMVADELKSAISMKASQIDLDAAAITLTAHKEQLDALQNALDTEVRLELSTLNKQMNALDGRTSQNETKLSSLSSDTKAEITALASRTSDSETMIAELKISISDALSEISLKADKVTLDSKVTKINGRLDLMDAEITGLKADSITANEVESIFNKSFQSKVADMTAYKLSAALFNVSGSMTYKNREVATQQWVHDKLAEYAKKNHTHAWSAITGKPSVFVPAAHRHRYAGTANKTTGAFSGTTDYN